MKKPGSRRVAALKLRKYEEGHDCEGKTYLLSFSELWQLVAVPGKTSCEAEAARLGGSCITTLADFDLPLCW